MVHCLDAKTGAIVYGPERLQAGHLQLVADAGRRPDLRLERGWADDGVQGGAARSRCWPRTRSSEYTLGSLATSDGQMFIRTAKHLYAIGARTKAVSANDAKKPAAAKKSGAKTAS